MGYQNEQKRTRLVRLAEKYDLDIITMAEPTFVTRAGRSGGGSSKVDLGIAKGWSAEIQLLKNEWMVTDHYGLVVEGGRTAGAGKVAEEKNRLPRRWRERDGEKVEDMEDAMINELRMRLRAQGVENQDVLTTILVENFKNRKAMRRQKRPINAECKALEQAYLEARREYENNMTEENERRKKEAAMEKRKAIKKLNRKLFAEKRVDLEGLTPTEFVTEVKKLRRWKPKMERWLRRRKD